MAKHYSGNKDMHQAVDTVVQAGWRHEFAGKHGRVYAPDSHLFIGHSLTPSDPHAFKAFKRDIGRLAAKLQLENPFMKELTIEPRWTDTVNGKPLNPRPPIDYRGEVPEPPKETPIKALDADAYTKIVELRKMNKSQAEVAEILTAMGYALRGGSPISQTAVSIFIKKMSSPTPKKATPSEALAKAREILKQKRAAGLIAPRAKKIAADPVVPMPTFPTVVEKKSHPFLTEVMEIVSSNMPEDMKERMLRLSARALVMKDEV